MPSILTDPHMIGVILLGLLGVAACVGGVYLIACRWRGRNPVPYCLSAVALFSLLYIATFEHALINAGIDVDATPETVLSLLLIGQALVTSIGVAVCVLVVFGAYLAMMGPLEFPAKRINSYAGCAIFCFVISILINPIDAVRKNEPANPSIYAAAMTRPTPERVRTATAEAERTLSQLRAIGALIRIEAGKTELVHHVRGQFLDLPNDVVKEYMRAALFHHIHVEGGTAKRVVLRVSDSAREIAQLDTDGRFRRNRAGAHQLGSLPLPPGS